jgi:beta-galactosidase
MPTRRHFLKSAAATAALTHPLSASIVRPFLQAAAKSGDDTAVKSLDTWFHYRNSLAGPWEAWHGDEIATWESVTLPHCFNHYDACDPDTPYYRGQGWYRTSIPTTIPANNGRVLLHFEGAGQTTTVWVNSQLIGTHVGGYDGFVFDITDALKSPSIPGSIKQPPNTVALTVLTDNSRDLKRSPSDLSDFSLYGGLYRKVHLVSVPAVSIEQVHITPTDVTSNPAKVRVDIKFYNPLKLKGDADVFISTSWFEEGSNLQAYAKDGEHDLHFDLDTQLATHEIVLEDPVLWSTSKPNCYTCTVDLHVESGNTRAEERFGLKHTEWVPHGPFKLNGERLLLNGTQRHMDHAHFAAAQPEDLIRKEFELMKAMGVNFIRLAHYQQTKFVLDLCDELGILVWEESTWCREGIGDAQWQSQTKTAFTNLINQHYNHPSILIWGLGNEDDWPNEYPTLDKTAIRKFMQEMHDLAHSLDPTRVTGFRRCDFASDIPDVYSPSIWAGWYSGLYTEYEKSLTTWREKVPHLIHIEWGADSHARRHAEDPYAHIPHIATGQGTAETGLAYRDTGGPPRISRDGDWSETYACDLFDWHLKTQGKLDWLTGSAQWIFKDFTTPLRAENPVPRINQKGVLERDLTQKEAYFVFQSYWTSEKSAPMVRIYGHTWPVRWGKPNELRTVQVYSNCPTAELFLNGKSLGVKKRNSQDFPCAGLRWETPFIAGKNHLKVVAKSSTSKTVADELDFTYQTEPWSKPAQLKISKLTANTVEATLHDDAGILCLDSRIPVRFSLAGPGTLNDNLGTGTGSRLIQLYNGRAQISFTSTTGPNTIAVTAEGITPASITVS